MNWNRKYLNLLKRYDKSGALYQTALNMMNTQMSNVPVSMHYNNVLFCVVSPVLVSYVLWIIHNAQKQNINKLYFLARDGYILCEIANILIQQIGYDIECKYIYCSRMSLRKALIYVDEEVAYDYLFEYNDNFNFYNIFDRIQLPKESVDKIVDILEISVEQLSGKLKECDFEEIKKAILKSDDCRQVLHNHSKSAYQNCVGYFEREGVLDFTNAALVDVGWKGTIQKSLRKIIEKANGNNVLMKGFYFGIVNPTDSDDGTYYSYYLKYNSFSHRRILFNNNVFECFCSANHGMTTGYKNENGNYDPILEEYKGNKMIDEQIKAVTLFARYLAKNYIGLLLSNPNYTNLLYKLLRAFMVSPSAEDANHYGAILFSDDSSNKYQISLVTELKYSDLKDYGITGHTAKLLGFNRNRKTRKVHWIHGSVRAMPKGFLKILFILNMTIWNVLRIVRLKIINYKI